MNQSFFESRHKSYIFCVFVFKSRHDIENLTICYDRRLFATAKELYDIFQSVDVLVPVSASVRNLPSQDLLGKHIKIESYFNIKPEESTDFLCIFNFMLVFCEKWNII